jgi:hypothetical protein
MPVADFPGLGPAACPNAVWSDGPNCKMLSWPVLVPDEKRSPQAKEALVFLNLLGLIITDVAPGKVQVAVISWINILKGERGEQAHARWLEGLDKRLLALAQP